MSQRIFIVLITLIVSGLMLTSCGNGEAASENNNADSTASADSSKKDSTQNNKKQADNSDLIPVEITKLVKGEISNFILLSSNLETEIQADVYPKVQGIVEKILAEEGQFVNKDQVMLKLEAREYEIAEKKAQVEYNKQLSNFERLKDLHAEKLLSDEEFEQAKYTKETALLTWQDAKLQLDYTSIRTPISGWVGERLTKVGARIQPTDKLFSVVNNSEMIAVVYVPEKNIGELEKNQPAIITSDHLGDKEFAGWIKRISPVVDPASGTFKVTVGLKSDGGLKPGMFVNVHLIISTHEDAVLVPKTAIVYENEYMNVFVVRDSVAHKIRLKAGFEDSKKVEALQDLQEGDQVIVVGQAGMKDKTKVRVVAERENTLLANKEK
ncbi:MAG: efflux RND transporter periplasmic adaptor subunit [Calditrichaeota bacterium]|nr:efflux RND transporter periplasmic adaptor subunit [Calditrichota bacterium]